MTRTALKLYIIAGGARSENALLNLKRVCEQAFGDGFDLEVVDVLTQPEEAESARILATPTLIKISPPPERRIVGDLSNPTALLRALGASVPATTQGGGRQ